MKIDLDFFENSEQELDNFDFQKIVFKTLKELKAQQASILDKLSKIISKDTEDIAHTNDQLSTLNDNFSSFNKEFRERNNLNFITSEARYYTTMQEWNTILKQRKLAYYKSIRCQGLRLIYS